MECERERASVALSAEQEGHTECASRCLRERSRAVIVIRLEFGEWCDR